MTTLGPQLDAYAREYNEIADPLWDKEYQGPKETGTGHHIGSGTIEDDVRMFGDRITKDLLRK